MDQHPISVLDDSPLPTQPPVITSPIYRKRPKTYGMIGRATPYVSDGENLTPQRKPDNTTIAIWDRARVVEPLIKQGIELISLSVSAKVGPYTHPDPEIKRFVRANLTRIRKWIYDATKSALWSGYAVSEVVYTPKIGPNSTPQSWLDDLVQYHPSVIDIVPNDHGRLTHGEKINFGYQRTGVWVPKPFNKYNDPIDNQVGHHKVRLPKSAVYHTCLNGEGNNPYGCSILSSVLNYHLFKQAIFDLMMIALDRYGTPLVYVVVPNVLTDEVDPEDPNRRLKLQEVTARELADIRTESVVIFSQPSKDQPVEMKSLTTSNNFADSFSKAIDMCDLNMMMGIGIPNLIMRDTNNGLGSSGASERQVEMFHHFVGSIYNQVTDDFLNQVVLQLIQFNFDPRIRPLAISPGVLTPLPIRWSEMKTLIQGIDTLTKNQYISPNNKVDMDHVRQMLFFPVLEEED
jgi:hypothetical protein